jgi:hypothetical protein
MAKSPCSGDRCSARAFVHEVTSDMQKQREKGAAPNMMGLPCRMALFYIAAAEEGPATTLYKDVAERCSAIDLPAVCWPVEASIQVLPINHV